MINMHAAKTQFSRLVEEVAAGGEVVIARAGKPVARLVPFHAPEVAHKRVLGGLVGRMTVPAGFDEPLPPDVVDAFEGS